MDRRTNRMRISVGFCVTAAVFLVFAIVTGGPHAVAGPPVRVELMDGSALNGELEGIDETQVTVVMNGRAQAMAKTEIRTLQLAATDRLEVQQGDSPIGRVRLIDESEFAIRRLRSESGELIVDDGSPQPHKLPLTDVQWIAFGEFSPQQERQWKAIRESVTSSDVLAVRRDAQTLATIAGVVQGLDEATVQFSFDGQELPVPVEKLAGIRFFSAASAQLGALQAMVRDTRGGRWSASQVLSGSGETIDVLLRCGARLRLDWDNVEAIDFAAGSVKYLQQLPALSESGRSVFPLLGTSLPTEPWYSPRWIEVSAGDGVSAGAGLEFLGHSEISFRLPPEFARFVGAIELRPGGEYVTPCRFQVWIDSEVVYDAVLRAPRQLQEINVAVRPDARLRLVSQPVGELPAGAVVLLRQPRLLR
ncbi:MAG: hypothetical protein KatS3mg111_2120 [Pirellulaceae bacterium]|nr:MAG: hypothetical protein KatS3mg111_2120 [Pirellulaceae bacterium]